MRIDRRLTIIGVMLVVLSMTMATQYVSTKIGYTYAVVHPSNADIRFVGFDNSTDQIRVLRTGGGANSSGNLNLTVSFGNVTENQNLTYTAAFGIVNEERFTVNITHIYVNTDDGSDYMEVWLHSNPNVLATEEQTANRAHIWGSGGPMGFSNSTCVWQMGSGNGDPDNLNGTATETEWDEYAYVRYTNDTSAWAVNGTSDYVWVQVSLNIPEGAATGRYNGVIVFYFEATTETTDDEDG